jgi:hypothetical protein
LGTLWAPPLRSSSPTLPRLCTPFARRSKPRSTPTRHLVITIKHILCVVY